MPADGAGQYSFTPASFISSLADLPCAAEVVTVANPVF